MLGAEARTFNLFPRCWLLAAGEKRGVRSHRQTCLSPSLLTSAVILWGPAVVKPLILE